MSKPRIVLPPSREDSLRDAKSFQAMYEKKWNEVQDLKKRISELKKSRIYWALFAGFMSALHVIIFFAWLIYK